jgi:hypothetical protein
MNETAETAMERITYGDNIWAEGEEFLKKADERFVLLIEKYGHCDIRPIEPEKYYISLIKAIIFRDFPSEAAQAAMAAIGMKHGEAPRPQDLIKDRFRGLSLPRLNERGTALGLTEKILAGEVPIESFPEMQDIEIVSCLRKVKGIER